MEAGSWQERLENPQGILTWKKKRDKSYAPNCTSNWFLKQIAKGNHHPCMYVHVPVLPHTRRPCVLGWWFWLSAQHLLLLQSDVGLLRHMLEMLLKSGLEAGSSIIKPQPDSLLPWFTDTTGVIYCTICQVPLHSHRLRQHLWCSWATPKPVKM